MVRLPRFRREQPRVEADTPHHFREISDPRLAAMGGLGAGGAQGAQTLSSVVLTDNYLRKSNCGVPGCGKPRHHPIHEAAAE